MASQCVVFQSTPPTTLSSSTKLAYGFRHRWLSSWTHLMTSLRTSSRAVSWAISCHLFSDTGILDFTQHTWTSTSASVLLEGVLQENARNKMSAMTSCFPGTYSSVKSYFWTLSSNLCSLGGASPSGFLDIAIRGLWSVFTTNSRPYTYQSNR